MADWTSANRKLMFDNRNSLLTLLTGLMILSWSCTPGLSNGTYKGKELITIAPGNTYWPGVITPWSNIKDISNRRWYHEVAITVKGSKASITKTPFYVKDGTKQYTDSTGGFYYYTGDIDYNTQDKTFRIFSILSSCKFCPRFATATPLYTYETYTIRRKRNRLVLNTDYEKGLIFTRQ